MAPAPGSRPGDALPCIPWLRVSSIVELQPSLTPLQCGPCLPHSLISFSGSRSTLQVLEMSLELWLCLLWPQCFSSIIFSSSLSPLLLAQSLAHRIPWLRGLGFTEALETRTTALSGQKPRHTHRVAQGTPLAALWRPKSEGNFSGRQRVGCFCWRERKLCSGRGCPLQAPLPFLEI